MLLECAALGLQGVRRAAGMIQSFLYVSISTCSD